MTERAQRRSWLRTLWPWAVGTAIVVLIATHVPLAKFRASLQQGPHIALAATELVTAIIVLFTDSLSTWIGLLALRIRWPLGKTTAIRGATYILTLANYALGQGGFGYYLYRDGQPAKRAVGATLFLLGTTLATLLSFTFAVWIIANAHGANEQMWWTLVGTMIAFGLYLVVIVARVKFLASVPALAPLFDAGLRGHAIAIAGRLPHVIVIVFAHWVALRVWGIPVPLEAAAVFMPAVALAATLPISPAGLGTIQAALVFFFAHYAAGSTPDERTATMLGFGVAHFVYGVISTALVGLACIPFARRTGVLTKEPAPKAS
jgi:hypothetical protein